MQGLFLGDDPKKKHLQYVTTRGIKFYTGLPKGSKQPNKIDRIYDCIKLDSLRHTDQNIKLGPQKGQKILQVNDEEVCRAVKFLK